MTRKRQSELHGNMQKAAEMTASARQLVGNSMKILWMGNLICSARRRQGSLNGITAPA